MGKLHNLKKDLIVFSHIKWSWDMRRPQHLMNKLARGRKILYIEEPEMGPSSAKKTIKIIKISRNIRVLQFTSKFDGDLCSISKLIQSQMVKWDLNSDPVLWFSSSVFKEMKDFLPHSLVVFDTVKYHPVKLANLIDKIESEMMLQADLVLTDFKDLLNVTGDVDHKYVFAPNSVDRYHFEKALDKTTLLPQEVQFSEQIILGFYGRIDRHIDFKLIGEVCKLAPDLRVLMIGELSGISKHDLPKNENFQYLGDKSYIEIPSYLKIFDMAILPFKTDKTNNYINQGKLLEYIAARKRIISTPSKYIPLEFKDIVSVAPDAKSFIDCVRNFLNEPFAKKVHREFLQDRLVRANSWDKLAIEIEEVINIQIQKKSMMEKGEEIKNSLM